MDDKDKPEIKISIHPYDRAVWVSGMGVPSAESKSVEAILLFKILTILERLLQKAEEQ